MNRVLARGELYYRAERGTEDLRIGGGQSPTRACVLFVVGSAKIVNVAVNQGEGTGCMVGRKNESGGSPRKVEGLEGKFVGNLVLLQCLRAARIVRRGKCLMRE